MTLPLDRFRNPDGSYNGVRAMAALSGVSDAEIMWIWRRFKSLVDGGWTSVEARAKVREEAKARPWERQA